MKIETMKHKQAMDKAKQAYSSLKGLLTKLPRIIDYRLSVPRIGVYQLMPLSEMGARSRALVDEIKVRHDIPEDAPEDLKNHSSPMHVTRHGRSASSLFTIDDLEGLATSPATVTLYYLVLWATYAFVGFTSTSGGAQGADNLHLPIALGAAAVAIYSIFHLWAGGNKKSSVAMGLSSLFVLGVTLASTAVNALAGTFGGGGQNIHSYVLHTIFFGAAVAPWLWLIKQDKLHTMALIAQSRMYSGGEAFAHLEDSPSRLAQIKQAIKEGNELTVHIGTALGVVGKHILTPWSPDAGMPMLTTHAAFGQHMMVFGASGTGKSAFLRALAYQLSFFHGLLALDFKAALAADLRLILDIIISPKTPCNILDGLPAGEFYNVLSGFANSADGSSGNKHFLNNGLRLTSNALICLRAINEKAVDEPYTVNGMRGYPNPGGLIRFVTYLKDKDNVTKTVNALRTYYGHEFKKLPELESQLRKVEPRLEEIHTRFFEMDKAENYYKTKAHKEEELKLIAEQLPLLEAFNKFKPEHTKLSGILTACNELEAMNTVGDDERGGFFTTADRLLQDFTSDESLKDWAESTNPPVNFEELWTKGRKIGIELGDLQGASGILYLTIFNNRFKKLAKHLSTQRHRTDLRPMVYMVDECTSLFKFDSPDGLGDDQFVSIARSLKAKCIFACQSESQLIGRFGADKVSAFMGNIQSFISYPTGEEATYAHMAKLIGSRSKIKKNRPTTQSIDFMETYNNKASDAIYDEHNPNLEKMRAQHGLFGVSSKYEEVKLTKQEFPLITMSVEKSENEPALTRELYTKYINSHQRVAFASIRRAGGYRQDFITPYALDENLQPYVPAVDSELDAEVKKSIEKAESAKVLLSNGKVIEAAELGMGD